MSDDQKQIDRMYSLERTVERLEKQRDQLAKQRLELINMNTDKKQQKEVISAEKKLLYYWLYLTFCSSYCGAIIWITHMTGVWYMDMLNNPILIPFWSAVISSAIIIICWCLTKMADIDSRPEK